MKVHQQFLVGRRDPDGRVEITTVAASADPETVRENESQCRAWIPETPDAVGRALVHVPVGDPAAGGAGDHLVAMLRGSADEVRIHLLRLDAEAFAVSGDDPFRPWRRGVLLEDWADDSSFPALEPMAIGNGLTAGLRALLPPQYPVLEALLRRTLADDALVLEVEADGPAVEDLLEQVLHLVPRSRRRTLRFHSATVDDGFDLGARIVPGARLREGLRHLTDASAPVLDAELEDYVTTLFALLRDHDYEGARSFIDDFGATTSVAADDAESTDAESTGAGSNAPAGAGPRVPRRALVFGALLVLAAAGTGLWLVLDGQDETPPPDVATSSEPLAVGPQPGLGDFLEVQTERVLDHTASGVARARLRTDLSAYRSVFERDARASWTADRVRADDRLREFADAEAATDSMVARFLRTVAADARDEIPRLHALHVAIAAGRPEWIDAHAAGPVPGRSSLAEEVRTWADALDDWAERFEVASADEPLPLPDVTTPTVDADPSGDTAR